MTDDTPATDLPGEADDPAATTVEKDERLTLATVATTIADAATSLAEGARRAIAERPGARIGRIRRMGDEPLANLWELHPEARLATLREAGTRAVPVELIYGTAVEGPVQRGGDFLPVANRRGVDWQARWQRILNGIDHLAVLPPIDVIKFGDDYWVLDGHNRVAAALYIGQSDVDANIVEALQPGVPALAARTEIAPYLEGSREVREAGAGRRRARTAHTHEPTEPPDDVAR